MWQVRNARGMAEARPVLRSARTSTAKDACHRTHVSGPVSSTHLESRALSPAQS